MGIPARPIVRNVLIAAPFPHCLRPCSPDGGSRPGFQLRHRQRLGACLFPLSFSLHTIISRYVSDFENSNAGLAPLPSFALAPSEFRIPNIYPRALLVVAIHR